MMIAVFGGKLLAQWNSPSSLSLVFYTQSTTTWEIGSVSAKDDEAGCSKSIFSPNSDSLSTKSTFLVGTLSALSLCFRFLDLFFFVFCRPDLLSRSFSFTRVIPSHVQCSWRTFGGSITPQIELINLITIHSSGPWQNFFLILRWVESQYSNARKKFFIYNTLNQS